MRQVNLEPMVIPLLCIIRTRPHIRNLSQMVLREKFVIMENQFI